MNINGKAFRDFYDDPEIWGPFTEQGQVLKGYHDEFLITINGQQHDFVDNENVPALLATLTEADQCEVVYGSITGKDENGKVATRCAHQVLADWAKKHLPAPAAINAQGNGQTLEINVIDSQFGPYLDLAMPDSANLLLICINQGAGYQPVDISLPHQCYLEKLKALKAKYPQAEITLMPLRSSEALHLKTKEL